MIKNIFLNIVQFFFKRSTQTTNKEIDNNEKYARDYTDIGNINFNSIFSNRLSNYVVADSNLVIGNDNKRVEFLSKIGQSLWKKMKKVVSMCLGYGGVVIVPYVKGGKLYYNLVPQNRFTIDKTDGDLITGATILAEIKHIKTSFADKTYYRWTNYNVENNNITIMQQYSDKEGNKIPTPDFWESIPETFTFSGVDRCLFGFIKSPVNNRKIKDDYGVPITYGCDETINEIMECLDQIRREFKLKECFVGADATLFDGKNSLSANGLFRKINSTTDDFFEVFDPAFRESSYYVRLQELYQRLEHEVGTSAGILSEASTQNATATEIRRAMYDTFTLVDDIRTNVEIGLADFFYACNVLANVYNLAPQGEYEVSYDWAYTLLEDPQQEFSQLIQGINQGVIDKVELRQFIKPDEDLEQAEAKIKEIEEKEPTTEELIGGVKE